MTEVATRSELIDDSSLSEGYELPATPGWRDQYPGMAALVDTFEADELYQAGKAGEKAQLRPLIVVDFVRSAVARNGNTLTFDEITLKQHIARIHNLYGPRGPMERNSHDRLDAIREAYTGLANTYDHLPEIAVAQHLYRTAYSLEMDEHTYSIETALTAYGVAVNSHTRQIRDEVLLLYPPN